MGQVMEPRQKGAAINVTITLQPPTNAHRVLSESIAEVIGEMNVKGYRLIQIYKNDILPERALWETILIFERVDPWPEEQDDTPTAMPISVKKERFS